MAPVRNFGKHSPSLTFLPSNISAISKNASHNEANENKVKLLPILSIDLFSVTYIPTSTVSINLLEAQGSIVVYCQTPTGHELGYFGWKEGEMQVEYLPEEGIVRVMYYCEPSLWSFGVRTVETRDFLEERAMMSTLMNFVKRGIEASAEDGNGLVGFMNICVDPTLLQHEYKNGRRKESVRPKSKNMNRHTLDKRIEKKNYKHCSRRQGHIQNNALMDRMIWEEGEIDATVHVSHRLTVEKITLELQKVSLD